MKKTGFHEANVRYGAQMKEMFGYYLPWVYAEGHVQEHVGTRKAASLCDLGYMAIFTIDGPDSLKFIQKLLTNDFQNMIDGQVRYSAMCNEDGVMLDDGTLWKLGTDRYLFISGDEGDYDWVVETAKGFNIQVKNITSEHMTLALQGPSSKKIVSQLTDADFGSLKYYSFIPGKVAGVDCLIARMGYTGEFGYEFHFDTKHSDHMWDAIMKAGKEHGIVPCGQQALESLRQEAGYILVGNEHNKTVNPFEAGIGWVAKFQKDGFNGKEALLRVLRNGIDKQLVWFRLSGGEEAETGNDVYFENQKIGAVTSGSFSPTSKAGTAMGYVNTKHAIAHAPCEIEIGGKRCQARLSIMPLYDPGDTRPKGTYMA